VPGRDPVVCKTSAVNVSPTLASDHPPRLEWAKRAVALTFAANGLAFGSWASRTPAVKSALNLQPSGLGLLLICLSIGSLIALPLSGAVVQWVGTRRAVLGSAGLETCGLLLAALGLSTGQVLVTGAGLVLTGLGVGTWDVAMNVEGAEVERRLGRSVMSRFHAAWSLGSVAGAGLGAVSASAGVSVSAQLVATAVVIAAMAVFGVSRYLTVGPPPLPEGAAGSRSRTREGWRDHRTLIIGVMVLAFAFMEGVANDWIALAAVTGVGASQALGAVTFGCFVSAMTLSRVLGGSLLDRWGRVVVLRGSALVAGIGVLLVISGPSLPLVLAGGLLWGVGTALGFPTGMSAAADDVPRAAIHVSVVSSIGYTAFLAGPPVVGFLADAVGVQQSLYVVLGAVLLGFVTSGRARRIQPGPG
jgi:MFS family permease